MEELYEILEGIQPEVDFRTAANLIDGHLLDSLSIISLIAELEDTFDISVPAVEIVPRNFNSAAAIWVLVQRLQEEG
ncbi:MAG: phosphopantetheine-binding protein [Clostridiales bacterium]|nr:phosphopantetheine-binding protein [Clostridiales bacterium]